MIKVVDNFCPLVKTVRASALEAGFSTWLPKPGYVGSSIYDGMGFWGKHSHMLASVSQAMQTVVYPNSMFFRYTTPETEPAYIHSDRETGAFTCIAYLSEHEEAYGTAFYRHKATGLTEMPSFADMPEEMKQDITGGPEPWEQIEFIPGKFNRAVIFSAPLFHSRFPLTGLGKSPEDARMIWATHFHTPASLMEIEHG